MKTLNRFFYAAMTAFASVALLASCEKEPQGGDDPTPDPEPSEPTQLATPSLSVEDQTNTSFTVTWKAVTNADSYTYTLNGGAEETTTSTSVEFTSLAAGDYTVKVKATSEDENYTDSEWASTEVTLEEDGGEETPTGWAGTWNITSTHTQVWAPDPDDNRYIVPQVNEVAKTGTLTITDEGEGLYYIYGLSSYRTDAGEEYPAMGMLDESGNLQIWAAQLTNADESGKYLAWTSVGHITADGYAPYYSGINGSYPAFTFTLSEKTATSTAYSSGVNLGNGVTGTFTVVSLNLVYTDGQSSSILGDDAFAGTLTLSYVSSDTSAAVLTKSSTVKVYSPIKVEYPTTTSFSAR